jgi:hypothetical protein
MKFQPRFRTFLCIVFMAALAVLQTEKVFAQSGRTNKSGGKTSESNPPKNDAGQKKTECPPTETYRFVAPLAVKEFINALNKLGACGYRLENVTHIPDERIENGYYQRDEIGTLKLAALVKSDTGEYEYDSLQIEQTRDLSLRLNEFAGRGFTFREVILFDGTFERYELGDNPNIYDEKMTAYIRQSKNLILLERIANSPNRVREYRVLKAGIGIGKNPGEKMKALLDETIKEGFRPVETFISSGFGTDKILDSYNGIILERTDEPQNTRIKFVRALQPGGFKDRVKELARQGFKVEVIKINQGLMSKPDSSSAPVIYQWLDTTSKTFSTNLSKINAEGAKYVASVAGGHRLIESRLVFEQTNQAQYEYRIIETENTKIQSLKSIDYQNFSWRLKQLIEQGFAVKEMFYNGNISILLERPR